MVLTSNLNFYTHFPQEMKLWPVRREKNTDDLQFKQTLTKQKAPYKAHDGQIVKDQVRGAYTA